MKYTIIYLLLLIGPLKAQTINGIPLDSLNTKFCQIVGTGKLFSNDLTIQLDFGQKNRYWSVKDTKVLDKDGKSVVLHSMIDALNFMESFGYEFNFAYVITTPTALGGVQNVYHYLLKKKN